MIIYGWGKVTTSDKGQTESQICIRCSNRVKRRLLIARTWFTLYFIPLIPYENKYSLVCPICGHVENFSRQDFKDLVSEAKSSLSISSPSDSMR